MAKRKFKLSHSLVGTAALLLVESALVWWWGAPAAAWCILAIALLGALGNIYVSMEVIEEVRNATHVLAMLSIVVMEFVVFFAFQYGFLLVLQPTSYPTLPIQPVPLLLHSVMVFVFNPLYVSDTVLGQTLMLINTLTALGLVLFILQNIWQFRRAEKSL